MRQRLSLVTFLMVLFLATSVYAASNSTKNCIAPFTDNMSQHITAIDYSGTMNTTTQNITCKFGCNNNTGDCYPSPYDITLNDIGLSISVIIIGLVLAYFGFNTKDDEWVIKLLYMVFSLLFLIVAASLLLNAAQNMNSAYETTMLNTYFALIILTTVIIFYYILQFFKDTIRAFYDKNKGKWSG